VQRPIEPLKRKTMDKETYNKAIAISNRLRQLQEVKNELKDTDSIHLVYAMKTEWGYSACTWIMKNISVILDKHDKMIRQEIDDEIAALNKEIEGL
jgi:hypothetical protein